MSRYHRLLPLSLVLALALAAPLAANAATNLGPLTLPGGVEKASERTAVTHHVLKREKGGNISYTATTGTLVIANKDGKPGASVFYIAYTRDGAGDAGKRPVTFLFNGGPGNPDTLLLMGSVGPVRVPTVDAGPTPPAPYRLVDNAYSLLDTSDLVFIDAVGTGYSRILDEGSAKSFFGVDEDANAFAKAITRWLTLTNRWASPKFLFGESYGTTRAPVVLKQLAEEDVHFNGLILLSSVLNYGDRILANDQYFAGIVPSYAATAWFHGKSRANAPSLEALVADARSFAFGEYLQALGKGETLPDDERRRVAERLATFTGLDADLIERANLRIQQPLFRKALLRAEGRTIGHFDARFKGQDADSAGNEPSYLAEAPAINGAYNAVFNDYVTKELGYKSDIPYYNKGPFNAYGDPQFWNWWHKAPDLPRSPIPVADVIPDLAKIVRENPSLQVLSANGYYDLGTPFAATEYDIAHAFVGKDLRRNFHFAYYESGHMVYVQESALAKFRADLGVFYAKSLQP